MSSHVNPAREPRAGVDQDLLEAVDDVDRPRTKWAVLAVSLAITLLVTIWSLVDSEGAYTILGAVVGFFANWFGWFYIALATVIVVFVIIVGVRYKSVRLGKPSDRPEFSTFSWAAMLFAAGIGTDVMFFSVSEPVAHYMAPPVGEAESLLAAREATVWTLFHYGITGWGMYTLMGIALGYFAHRIGLPLAVRSALYPLVGKRIKGPIGAAVDVATVVGTIFGVATSLGIGVVMLNVGLDILFGVNQGLGAQIGLVVLAVGMATVSAVSGVDKGIRILSQLNVLLGVLLGLWVLVTGNTAFLLRAITMNIGDFIAWFPGMTLDTMAFDHPAEWMNGWTLFFWAWWIAWASFVGMFLARISKGRTIGQFVIGTLTIPFIYIVMWVSIFGNAALDRIRNGGDQEFAQTTVDTPEVGFYSLLQDYPGAFFLIGLATFVGLLFYVTSADSGSLVMANLSSRLPDTETDARWYLRVLWAVVTGLLTVAMLTVDGIAALQNATIVMGLPFAFVMIAVMVGLARSLERERALHYARRATLTAALVARRTTSDPDSWRMRLSAQFGLLGAKAARKHFDTVVMPALEAVCDEFTETGASAAVELDEEPEEDRVVRAATLVVGESRPFRYQVRLRRVPAPSYGAGVREASDTNMRVEVNLPELDPYDVISYRTDHLCHDITEAYQRYLVTGQAVDQL